MKSVLGWCRGLRLPYFAVLASGGDFSVYIFPMTGKVNREVIVATAEKEKVAEIASHHQREDFPPLPDDPPIWEEHRHYTISSAHAQ